MAQAVAPTTFGLDAHGGHGFESGPMSFLLSTPQLFSLSFPVPLFTKTIDKSPKINLKKKLKKTTCPLISQCSPEDVVNPVDVQVTFSFQGLPIQSAGELRPKLASSSSNTSDHKVRASKLFWDQVQCPNRPQHNSQCFMFLCPKVQNTFPHRDK